MNIFYILFRYLFILTDKYDVINTFVFKEGFGFYFQWSFYDLVFFIGFTEFKQFLVHSYRNLHPFFKYEIP